MVVRASGRLCGAPVTTAHVHRRRLGLPLRMASWHVTHPLSLPVTQLIAGTCELVPVPNNTSSLSQVEVGAATATPLDMVQRQRVEARGFHHDGVFHCRWQPQRTARCEIHTRAYDLRTHGSRTCDPLQCHGAISAYRRCGPTDSSLECQDWRAGRS